MSRCEAAGLVRRERAGEDQRKVHVMLTALGERKVQAIASVHREELDHLLEHIQQAVGDGGE